jgi:putative protease
VKRLELLAPARNADFGMAAIDHGADAVYIGGPVFSARAAAANDLKAIERLVGHAHLYHSRVYVALNTLLTDRELEKAHQLIGQLHDIGIDGLIIQDMGLLELDLPSIPLIASTQTHNTTPEKVRFLQDVGFQRVILARELTLDEIRQIRKETTVGLECFVHGALCVSYSGQCFMSQVLGGRSANRGVCAQPCRSLYSLVDGNGRTIVKDKHLLSLKDLNLSESLDDLIQAGITSFKIEGRYKDLHYVKNVTAAYRQALDAAMERIPGTMKSSSGCCRYFFIPDLRKTFNRGYTTYFLKGRDHKPGSPDTQKSIGKLVGRVSRVNPEFIDVTGGPFHNGDGLCFFGSDGDLDGFQVNTAKGSRLYPHQMPSIEVGTDLYRNFDQVLFRQLKKKSAERRIAVWMDFFQNAYEIGLNVVDEDGCRATLTLPQSFIPARNPESCQQQIGAQLSKLGDSIYKLQKLDLSQGSTGFLPIRNLNQLRRKALAKLSRIRLRHHLQYGLSSDPDTEDRSSVRHPAIPETDMLFSRERAGCPDVGNEIPYPEKYLDYRSNIMNHAARRFYEHHGATVAELALETLHPVGRAKPSRTVVMTCRYCIRHQLDACPRFSRPCRRLKDPLILKNSRHVFEVTFDCRLCQMSIVFRGDRIVA